jgi:hypothetical protein
MPIVELSPDDQLDTPGAAPPPATPAPAETADPGIAALSRSGIRPGYGLTDAVARGLTFGLSDPVSAAGAATAGGLPGLGGWSERYQQALRREQDAAAQYRADSPILSRAGPLLGMLATSAPGALSTAARATPSVARQVAQGLTFGVGTGAAEAVPQATQEPTWGRAATDVGLGATIGGAGMGATAPIGGVVGAGIPAAVKAAPLAIGGAIGEHFFPGMEGLIGSLIGKEMLGPVARAATPAAEATGRFLQRYLPGPGTRTTAAVPSSLIQYLMPGQPTGGVQPAQ